MTGLTSLALATTSTADFRRGRRTLLQGCRHPMPLTAERLKEIQDECLADDVDVPPEATAWTDEQA